MSTDSHPSTAFRLSRRWIRIATLLNEWYDDVSDPEAAVAELRRTRSPADLFSFIQRPPDQSAPLPYHFEMDHVAAIPVSTFTEWWDNQVIKKVRKNVRRSQKYGVVVKQVRFDDDLVRGILEIYREVPLRSGRPFRHFGDDFETCKRKHETFLDRSLFIGAFHENRLIGFIKMVVAGTTARTMQNISLDEYRDWSPANALMAQCVQVCAERGISYLVYGKLSYGNKGNAGLEEFKRSNGFQKLSFRRYYIPVTTVGQLALRTGLHRDFSEYIPLSVVQLARSIRTRYYSAKYGQTSERRAVATENAASE